MIVIVDYGMGNLFSIKSALDYIGADSVISFDPDIIENADKLILPGVGSFKKAIINLKKNNLYDVIKRSINERQTPILGICLGMQLLGLSSTEDGLSVGFGFIDSTVERFNCSISDNFKIPHVGFETINILRKSKLLEGLNSQVDFYFTHSYRMVFEDQVCVVGTCFHGETFIAVLEKDNICGTQFHPEKSQTNGLVVLKNFIEKF